jgi:hypothetical protein
MNYYKSIKTNNEHKEGFVKESQLGVSKEENQRRLEDIKNKLALEMHMIKSLLNNDRLIVEKMEKDDSFSKRISILLEETEKITKDLYDATSNYMGSITNTQEAYERWRMNREDDFWRNKKIKGHF